MDTSALRSPSGRSLPVGLKGPRGEILVELKRAPQLTAKELARQLGCSLNGIRHHLKELEAEGLVTYERRHQGVGAPVFVYRLSPLAEGLFPRRYEAALLEFLDHLVAHEGREAAVTVLEGHYAALARRLSAELEGAPPARRLEVVTRALADEGYMAESRRQHGDSFATLTEHNCAVQAVAQRFPELCRAEAKFLEAALGAPVDRRAHILGGCGSCEYHVRFDDHKHAEGTV
ncbi:MAG TPA: helix-turn-helix domain-containing protein [Gemmatimonadales bacterium]|nr:helix-turn-helix domain-containing protein [Gemmatimonadales bacterium]